MKKSILGNIRITFTIITILMLLICVTGFYVVQNIDAEIMTEDFQMFLKAVFVVYTIAAIASCMVAMAVLYRKLTKPVQQLIDILDNLAKGNVDVEFMKYEQDEIGVITEKAMEVVKNMREHVKLADSMAAGDLTVSAHIMSDKDALGHALDKMVHDNNSVLLGIRESSMQLTAGAGQVASASQALAQGSTEQASAIEQITASMDLIAQKTKENASMAMNADKRMHAMAADAVQGNGKMQDMVEAMNDINQSSHSISKVIKTIDDIAFQTNILALNATVEAARAGVHGKGFAVVAEEVKNLAEKSAQAAQETAELIQSSIDKVKEGSRHAADVAAVLENMVNALEDAVHNVDDIAELSNEQATSVAQINQAISQVSQVVQTNSATSEQCASASEQLSNQAEGLRRLIAKYHLKSSRTL